MLSPLTQHLKSHSWFRAKSSGGTSQLLAHHTSAEICTALLCCFAAGLCPLPTLDSPGLWSLNMVTGNPFLIIPLGARRTGSTLCVGLVAASIRLFAFGSFCRSRLAFRREIRHDPDGVEEVADADGASKEEEVQEDAKSVSWFTKSWALRRVTYIWGSKMLVSGSTTATVPLKAITV